MRFVSLGRRLLGALLLLLILLPWYRLVGARAAGPAVEQTLGLGGPYLLAGWVGLALAVVGASLIGWLTPTGQVSRLWLRAEKALLLPGSGRFGVVLGALAALIALWVSRSILDGKPALLDPISQLIQARYLAAGMLAGPPLEDPEFWHFQFMVLTDAGWVSQYPPGFPTLLAAAWSLGVTWLVGPLLVGSAVLLTTFVAERMLPDDRVVARIGIVLMALSPFLAFHAAAYMNHVLAMTLIVMAVYASLRAMDGSWSWSLLAGAAVGWCFATRPFTGLVLGSFATIGVWLAGPGQRRLTWREWVSRLTGAGVGAVPFAFGVFAWNSALFGGPFRFGYLAGEGPGHAMGFHVDPWGNPYGLPEAIGYTSADLMGLSLDLLQTPIPAVAVVALYLAVSPRLGRGVRLAATWALLPVGAQFFYWHHDLFMGPRLLYEAVPGWCLLLAAAAVGLVRALPEEGRWPLLRVAPRAGLAGVFGLALFIAITFSIPRKLASYQYMAAGARAPEVERPSLVFVHGSWEDRLGARLSALGLRMDSVRLALRHNSTCRVELSLARSEVGGTGGSATQAAPMDLRFQGSTGPPLRELRMPSASVIRSYDGETLDPTCERQAASDFAGVLALPPLVWLGDLPGLGSDGAMFVRDLGPENNARLITKFPDREPRVLRRRGGEISLTSYESGMADLWSTPR